MNRAQDTDGGFEPKFIDATPCSTGGNARQTGRFVSVRYVYC